MDVPTIRGGHSIGGHWDNEFQGRSVRPYNQNDIVTIGFATGGAGPGGPPGRGPAPGGGGRPPRNNSQGAAGGGPPGVWRPHPRTGGLPAPREPAGRPH